MPSSYLYLNGLRHHYLHWNLEDNGSPLLFLHALGANARTWEPVAACLAGEGYTLLAPDLRGHGQTDSPDEDYSLAAIASDLASFLAMADLGRPVIIGHAWGALLALDYAARFPFGPRAPAGIVLVDGGLAQWDEVAWDQARTRLAPSQPENIPLSDFLERMQAGLNGWVPDEETIPLILASYQIDDEELLCSRLSSENRHKLAREMWEYRTGNAFQKLRCPVLALPASPLPGAAPADPLVWELTRNGVERFAQGKNRVHLEWIPAASAEILLEQPQALADHILVFVRSLP